MAGITGRSGNFGNFGTIGKEFDVAKNIKMTESLQCQLLAAVSSFFTAMSENGTKAEKAELLADMEILIFLLAVRLGVSEDSLNQKAVAKIRLGLVQEEKEDWQPLLLEVLHQLERKNR